MSTLVNSFQTQSDSRTPAISPVRRRGLTPKNAAIRIQQCWRRHSASILAIEPNTLIQMPHVIFKRYVAIVLHKHPGSFEALNLKAIVAQRTYESISSGVPIVTTRGGFRGDEVRLPTYAYPDQLPEKVEMAAQPQHGLFALSSKVQKEIIDIRSHIVSIDELDAFVRKLASFDLIAWDLEEGYCWARANLTVQILFLMGIPERHLYKEIALIPCDFRSVDRWSQYYHVAAMVTLYDKTSWIIDPALNKQKAMKIEEWYQRLKSASEISDQIEDRLEINSSDQQRVITAISCNYEDLKQDAKRFERPNQLDALVQVSPKYDLIVSEQRYQLVDDEVFGSARFFDLLAKSRSRVEERWLTERPLLKF